MDRARERFASPETSFDRVTIRQLAEMGVAAGRPCLEVGGGGANLEQVRDRPTDLSLVSDQEIDHFLQLIAGSDFSRNFYPLISARARRSPR